MDNVLQNFKKFTHARVDDIAVFTDGSFEDHARDLQCIFDRLHQTSCQFEAIQVPPWDL